MTQSDFESKPVLLFKLGRHRLAIRFVSLAVLAMATLFAGGFSPRSLTEPVIIQQTEPELMEKLVQDEDFIDFSGAGSRSLVASKLTSDQTRLVMVRDFLSSNEPFYGLSVVSLNDGQVATGLAPEEGRPLDVDVFQETAYVAVSRAVGTTVTDGRNRVDVFSIDGPTPVFQRSIVFENSLSEFGPAGVALTPGGDRGYVSNRGNSLIHVFDAHNTEDPLIDSVEVFGDPTGIAASPDGSRVYVAVRSFPAVFCIDTTTNQLGGTQACPFEGMIYPSLAPSGISCDIVMAPDGTRAYVACPGSDPCISVIDTDLASPDLNQEIAIWPATSDRLESLDISRNGRTLFAVSRFRQEILLFDTETGRQIQRVPLSRDSDPLTVTFAGLESAAADSDNSFLGTAYVGDRLNRRGLILNPGTANFLAPDGDSMRSAGLVDTRSEAEGCPDPYTADQPDPGLDEEMAARVNPTAGNCYFFAVYGAVWEVCFSPDDPYNFVVYPPAANGGNQSSGIFSRMVARLKEFLGVGDFQKHTFNIFGLDPMLRPVSAVVTSVNGDGEETESRLEVRDENGDGLMDGLITVSPLDIPLSGFAPMLFDTDGNDPRVITPPGVRTLRAGFSSCR